MQPIAIILVLKSDLPSCTIALKRSTAVQLGQASLKIRYAPTISVEDLQGGTA